MSPEEMETYLELSQKLIGHTTRLGMAKTTVDRFRRAADAIPLVLDFERRKK